MHITKSARLAGRLAQRDPGEGSGVHSVAGRLIGEADVPYADPDVARAVEELTEQRGYHLDHVGRGSARRIRAEVEVLSELVGWLSGPTDATVHLVSGTVHVFVDSVEADRSMGKATGRIVVRDHRGELRFWPFNNLRTPPVADVDATMAFAAAAAVDVMGFDRTGTRANGVPVWAPPAEICDAIHDGAQRDSAGQVVVGAAAKGEEP